MISFRQQQQMEWCVLLSNRKRIPEAKGTQDFLGIDYYTRDYVSFQPIQIGVNYSASVSFDRSAELSTTGFLGQ